ncbi:MAG: DNA gyrase subunit A [Candidatus Thermoplasmatota archaeon]|nr:DNA gyrase subunit A [Candidatus Thermoplasmatota archaeon]
MEKIERGGVVGKELVEELSTSYLNYSMSVIVGRALPDARDGLKPVHRRILHAMNEGGMVFGKPYKKSARVVGDVLGKYHPHGDSAVYDAMVRMAQSFSLRYPLIDGQGNFGSIDGDSAAAMRYTESRTTKIATEMLEDIDKETVDMVPNYDGSLEEPTVLPAKLPNLIVNGTSGIAVGMATNMPPHNLGEVVDGLLLLLGDPEVDTLRLMEVIQAPDFPTGGTIYGKNGVYQAYSTGRGKVTVRGKAEIEETESGRHRIIVSEIPYMVNKSNMLQKIAELVKAKLFDGISDIRDESDKDGLRVVFELKKDAVPEVVLNKLYAHSDMQSTFGIINLAIVNGQPRILTLKEILAVFLEHRRDVIRRRVTFDLKKARERLHIIEGLIIALDNIDEVIRLIRASNDVSVAQSGLMEKFELSDIQAKAILDMRLQKLTSLESSAIKEEGRKLVETIADYEDILDRPERVDSIISGDLIYLKEKFSDPRRTMIEPDAEEIDMEDLIVRRDIVVTITNTGYIKRIDLDTYKIQNRGGKGLRGMGIKDEDYVVDMFICSSHDYIMLFTSLGKVFWVKGYDIPSGSRQAKGRPIIHLLPNLEDGEVVRSFISVSDFDSDRYLLFATRNGLVKRTSLESYSRPRSTGIKAILLNEGDELVSTQICNEDNEAVLATKKGMANRFRVSDVRAMGRTSMGVIGMRSKYDNDEIISLAVIPGAGGEPVDENQEDDLPEESIEETEETGEGPLLLTITEKGYGKRAYAQNYRLTRRGSAGVINIHPDHIEETGTVVKLMVERPDSEILLVSREGMVIRTISSCIRLVNRVAKGVIVMRLNEGDRVNAVAMIERIEDVEESIAECDLPTEEEQVTDEEQDRSSFLEE